MKENSHGYILEKKLKLLFGDLSKKTNYYMKTDT